ncbi:MAG: hypothetical protein N2561_02465 [Bacteroidetes bacterium]|nr:hypothetical protein [Rhodothermia bacterium]MCS7154666.1 hypothetical protein [Bacteroidota bacterium]MCX7906383.1 hypothetical protein [Bacteroidota bacterium]MDW8137459.1 hypothetical protein [Bacteroidota bacterium]MDW8285587.1 hypothetical protein [Bacteroidota bacterium]
MAVFGGAVIRRGAFRMQPDAAQVQTYGPLLFPELSGEAVEGGRIESPEAQTPAAAPSPEPSEEEANRLEQARAEGFSAGYEAARAELELSYRQQLGALEERLAAELIRLQGAFESFCEAMARTTAALALRLAEKILDSPLEAESLQPALERRLKRIVASVAHVQPIEVRLPVGWVQRLGACSPALRCVEDPELKPGEFVVETPTEKFALRFREALRSLEEELRWTHEVG